MTAFFDVRAGEGRGRLLGFAGLLLLVITAHTTLETARDALLLSGPGPRALGFVYICIAAGTVPGAAVAARLGARFGQRKALAATLGVAVAGPVLLFLVPASHAAAIATYVLSGILGSIVVPQFWTLVGTVLTVGQGRRLFGFISAAGVLGGVLGPAVASGVLVVLPAKALLLVSSGVFALAAAMLAFVRPSERLPEVGPSRRVPLTSSLRVFRETPFLRWVAAVVFLSTATFLSLDYLFKSSVAHALAPPDLARFIAHFYLLLNGLSLLVQLTSSTVVRRLGVLPALVPTPLLLLGGALVAVASGGALPGVLLVKGIDGSLRYSIHRVTGELMYLPVPSAARQRTKPLIDGGLARIAQAVTGASLLAIGGTRWTHPAPLAALVAVLAAGWLATVFGMRRPYLELLRSAVTSGSLETSDNLEPIDLETAQLLVQRLASEDPYEVEAAMTTLARRERSGFVPALVLLHADEGVLVQALEMFGASLRSDWFPLARRLLADPRESVRVAAARALARHEQLDPASLANDVGWRARGYGAVRMAMRDATTLVQRSRSVATLLDQGGEAGEAARLGILAAIADSPRTLRLRPLLGRLAEEPSPSAAKIELIARAVAMQEHAALVPRLVALLGVRAAREAVRSALVEFGAPALDEVLRTLRDPLRDHRLRLHLPKTIARFASKRAADCLLEVIQSESDGLLRYKSIRALRLLVSRHLIHVDRMKVERLSRLNLEEHFRRLALRVILDGSAQLDATAAALLSELLDEKARHGLERAFQLMQIAHPRRGLHRAYIASKSADAFARANAAELIDALLRRRDQQRLRALFRLATDDLPDAERIERARPLLPSLPRTHEDAMDALAGGRDAILVALGERLRAPRSEPPLAQAIPLATARMKR